MTSNPNTMIVQKFGGTSLETPEKIRHVAGRVVEEKKVGKQVIVVVSAMGNTTDRLFELAKRVTSNPPKREIDMLLTAGERISMALLSMAISDLGYQAISFTGSQSGIVTDTSHTRAKIVDVRAYRVREELEKGRIVIVAGFQGVSPTKEVTTLGRGGSDTTCVALAAAFEAQECEIFTDVDGIYTADPRLVPEARKIDRISYEEMLELSFCGAQVLHWRSVDVAERFGVRVHVRSPFRKEMGTIVTAKEQIETAQIRGITQDVDLARIFFNDTGNAVDLARRVLHVLEEVEIPVRSLCILPESAGSGSLSILLPRDYADFAVRSISKEMPDQDFTVSNDIATVSVVGQGLYNMPGIAKKILASLASLGIQPEIVTTSGIALTMALDRSRMIQAIRKLHSDLGLEDVTQNEVQ